MNNVTSSGLISPHHTYSPTLQLVLFCDVPSLTMVTQQVQLMGGGKEKDITMSFHLILLG
jgi:hypothetical protein